MRTGNVIVRYLIAALVVLLVAYAVPWVRADRETRRSMWQARLIRWRWARLARMTGPGRQRSDADRAVGTPG